jgi:hypothetical protein
MNKGRRIGALVAATVAAIGMTMTVTTAPASAAKKVRGPQPVSQLLSTVNDKSATWVDVLFKTDVKVCKFKLVVWGNSKVSISYPEVNNMLRPYTSLSKNAQLNKNELDYASFKVTTGDFTRTQWSILPATMYYTNCGKKAKLQSKSTGFLLPVRNVS